MPTYQYRCPTCDGVTERFHRTIPELVPNGVRCNHCGKRARRSYAATAMPQTDRFRPYWTNNMGHWPVYVRSRAHEARLCRERHLERVS